MSREIFQVFDQSLYSVRQLEAMPGPQFQAPRVHVQSQVLYVAAKFFLTGRARIRHRPGEHMSIYVTRFHDKHFRLLRSSGRGNAHRHLSPRYVKVSYFLQENMIL